MLHLNRAVNSLRGFGSWYNASLRLLSDLVECAADTKDADKEFRPSSLEFYVGMAKKASFSLYWSLDLKGWSADARDGPPLHLLWLCEKKGLNAPLEALAHLLASTIAREHNEPAAVATLQEGSKDSVHLTLWRSAESVETTSAKADEKSIASALGIGRGENQPPFCHLVFVGPAGGAIPLAKRFHRILFLTNDPDVTMVPRQAKNFRAILKPEVFKSPRTKLPHYCAIIPTVIACPAKTKPGDEHADLGLSRAAKAWWSAGGIRTEPITDQEELNTSPHKRLHRDLCRLTLDLDKIAERWANRKPGEVPLLTRREDLNGRSAARWARAVTNRQVGLALSGGGASSYHLVPLIEQLAEKRVPIDVVSGVSGGALLGAYFCAHGRAGLDLAVENGPQFTWYALAAILDSRVIQYKVDYDLDAVRVEDLDVRFVAITTALRDNARPHGDAVVGGTLGQAVRLSGSAPIEFGRTMTGSTRFTDGASATIVPARVLRDYGADIVFACNSIPGPSSGNPLSGLHSKAWLPLRGVVHFLTRYTGLGRFVDAWVAAAYLVQQSSRVVQEDASEYAEPAAGPVPLVDSVRFWAAAELADPHRAVGSRGLTKGMHGHRSAGERFWDRWTQCKMSPRLRETR